ncbi:MAG TPA: amidohydrolase family protein [Vicinamibacteria bacterium]|nr:amidohydrolase family protein [Vicinamibacteria bacterium]
MGRRALALGLLSSLLGSTSGAERIDLVLREGTNLAAARAPDGSYVLDLQGTLWHLPPEGGTASPLTDGMGDDRLPDVTPDGSRIVYQSYRNGTWDIWAVDSDGSNAVALTEGSADDREPAVSPNGARVAFSSDRLGSYDVYVLDLQSGDIVPVTEGPENDYMPCWSPKGDHIVFVSEREPAGLYRVDVSGPSLGQPTLVASFPGRIASPSYSPDGSRIAVRVLEDRSSSLVIVAASGGSPSKVATPPDVYPFRADWVDEKALVFTAAGSLWHQAVDDTEATRVLFEAKVTLDRPAYRRRSVEFSDERVQRRVKGFVRPVISPDDSMIAYAALGDIWIVPTEGGQSIPMTRDEHLDTDPDWSPDASRLVFSSDRAGTMDIWIRDVVEPPGSGEKRLTTSLGAELSPAWSPDGKTIAYLDDRSRLHVVSVDGTEDRTLTESRRGASMPTWSADSVHVAMAVHVPVSTRFREGINRILVVDTRTGESRLLDQPDGSFGTRDGDGPVWKPDGTAMAMAMDGALWVLPVSLDGTPQESPRQIGGEAVDFPSWSKDGERLVYVSPRGISELSVAPSTVRDLELGQVYEDVPAGGRFVVRDVRVVDGTGGPARDHMDVVVQGNRIESVEPTGAFVDPDVRVVDGSGKTLVPGLIDMHTHLSLPAWGARQGKIWLAHGVTSIRTPADAPYRVLEERESISAGRRIGPRIFYTGGAMDGDRIYYTGALAVGDPEELEQELARARELDYDLIKTYVRLPDELQSIVVRTAHAQGVFVTSHEVYPAVAFGIDGIEHIRGTSRRGFSPKVSDLGRSYDDVIELIARSKVYFTPTVLIHGGWALARSREPELLEDRRIQLYPPFFQEDLRNAEPGDFPTEAIEPYFATVSAIAERGGNVLAGTDSPIVPYGLSLLVEIEQLSEAGLGPLGAIRSATLLAAQALGAAADLGTIEPDKVADLVLVDGDPTANIRDLRKTEAVAIGGRLLTVEQLLR